MTDTVTNRIIPVNELPVAELGKDGRKIRTPDFRRRMVAEVARMQTEEGKSVKEACTILNLDTSGFYKWRMSMSKSKQAVKTLKELRKSIKPTGRNGKTKIGLTRNEDQMRETIFQVDAMKKTQDMTAKQACAKVKLGLSQYFKWKKIFTLQTARAAKAAKAAAKNTTKSSAPATPTPSPAAPVLILECRFCPICGFHLTDSNNAVRRTLGK